MSATTAPATAAGSGRHPTIQVSTQDNEQGTQVDNVLTFEERILQFCIVPRSKREITEYMGYKDAKSFGIRYIKPMVETGKLKMSIPEKPNSRNQKYVVKED